MSASTVAELSLELGVKLEISLEKHPESRKYQWRCHMRCVALPAKKGHHRPSYGWGRTPGIALRDYAGSIAGRTVEVHPYAHCRPDVRSDFFVPSDLKT